MGHLLLSLPALGHSVCIVSKLFTCQSGPLLSACSSNSGKSAARGDETLRHSPYKRLSQAIEGLEEGAVGQDKEGVKHAPSPLLIASPQGFHAKG